MTQTVIPTSSAIRRRAASQGSAQTPGACFGGSTGSEGAGKPRSAYLRTAAALGLFLGVSVPSFLAAHTDLWLSLTALAGAAALRLAFAPAWRSASALEGADAAKTVGPYTLTEKIGEGGMGVVYKARHALLERPTAIKLLHPSHARPEDVRRFEREVQLTSKLTHPNTISIYDFGRTPDGAFYYAMEYLDGLDLQTLVEREGPQNPARVAHLLAQICGALAEAHGVGLIHRDIKPANIVLCERGGVKDVVKVLDFGLIKQFENRPADLTHSDLQSIVGTPFYLSPEALIAPDTMDGRSDLYAVGVVGYFLLTGELPFTGNGLLEVCAHHLHTAPTAPSERSGRRIPEKLEALILSCLHKSMAGRPTSAAQLRDALLPLAAAWTLGPKLARVAGALR